MPNADISRHLNQPRKHYSGARLQQGRPLLDSDFNEGAEARADLWRAALVDIVGAAGSQDDGFMPALKVGDTVTSKLVRFGASTQAFVLDYPLKAGSMYVGGALWEQAAAEPVIFQRGFLQMGAATAPRAGLGEQRQLSYLRGWEQPVTAVEDGEMLEPSLGGADSAARVRRVRRVEVRNVQATDCAAAFAEVLEDLGHGDTATYDAATCELRSNARLQMTFQGSPAAECGPCQPSLEGRYLGGESHAIRIMLTAPDRYVWAYDNAAPLYRVRLVLDGAGGSRVEMLTPPKDTFHHPRQQTVVEFLPWEALLDNGRAQDGPSTGATFVNEKIAARVGILAEVDGPYDPAARTFHVRLAPGSAQQIGVGTGTTDSKAEKQAAINLKTGTVPEQDGFALRWDPATPLRRTAQPDRQQPRRLRHLPLHARLAPEADRRRADHPDLLRPAARADRARPRLHRPRPRRRLLDHRRPARGARRDPAARDHAAGRRAAARAARGGGADLPADVALPDRGRPRGRPHRRLPADAAGAHPARLLHLRRRARGATSRRFRRPSTPCP